MCDKIISTQDALICIFRTSYSFLGQMTTTDPVHLHSVPLIGIAALLLP